MQLLFVSLSLARTSSTHIISSSPPKRLYNCRCNNTQFTLFYLNPNAIPLIENQLCIQMFSLFAIAGLVAGWGAAGFLNNRPYPTYSLESMPDTDFTCRDKILGGYYADSQTQCQMFHICVKVAGVGVSFVFLRFRR